MTRSPGASPATSGPTSLTTPDSSLPGENGSDGLNWYLFSMIRTSGKLTLAARTETRTSPACGRGDGTSRYSRSSGGPNVVQSKAFMRYRHVRSPCRARRERSRALDAPGCRPSEVRHAIAETGEPFVGRVSVKVAVIDLLNDGGNLEECEDLEVRQRLEAPTALLGVSIDQLGLIGPSWPVGD